MRIPHDEWISRTEAFLRNLERTTATLVRCGKYGAAPRFVVSTAERLPEGLEIHHDRGGHRFTLSLVDDSSGEKKDICSVGKYDGSSVVILCCLDDLVPTALIAEIMELTRDTGTCLDIRVLHE